MFMRKTLMNLNKGLVLLWLSVTISGFGDYFSHVAVLDNVREAWRTNSDSWLDGIQHRGHHSCRTVCWCVDR